MENYLETVYDMKSHPVTAYPNELARYLIARYNISQEAKLLDVGCGRGDFLNAFRDEGLRAYGVDSPSKNGFIPVDCYAGGVDLETDTISFPDSEFDVIFTKSVLEHIHRPSNILNECYRVLKPGGRIIAMVPDWKTCMYIYYDDFTHVQPYTVDALRDALKMFQFRDVESEAFYQLPIVWKYPCVKVLCKMLQLLGPVKKVHKNKFYRFSRELIILASGIK